MHAKVNEAYNGDVEEAKFAISVIQQINKDLELREKNTLVFNGLSYSQSYLYNQRKAINYSPPRQAGKEREVSMGLVHEKIISFAAFFLKYIYKRRVKCYDESGKIVRGMGEIYNLGIEHSYRLERFKKKIALLYWEVFSQGDAFVLDDWQVRNIPQSIAKKDDQIIKPDGMEYTYEFLDGLSYEDGEMIQTRQAVSKVLDGRTIILGNPEIEDLQDQPRVTLEEVISREDAELIYKSLKRWKQVPNEKDWITNVTGEDKVTLFDATRVADVGKETVVHRYFDKEKNRFNIFLNGVMMLPRKTPMTLFYLRGNYPLTKVSGERLTGSAYSRSIPAKTKFNGDFVDWALQGLANKFEQGLDPALLIKGRYTITRDIFRGGQRTHGVAKSDYEKADPDNKGITAPEFSFVKLLKEILESQTLNQTTTGEIADQATATAINAAQTNQIEKLGYLLDGIVNGFADMALRRAETIESKYTIKQKETIVDGKKINVYQNFTVSMGGMENSVVFDEEVGGETYDIGAKRDELFTKSFKDKKEGFPTAYYLVNPDSLRNKKYGIDIEMVPERIKDTQLQIMQMREEFGFLRETFGSILNIETLKDEYLQVSGRPSELFMPMDAMKLNEMLANQQGIGQNNTGSFGKPKVKKALQESMR